MSETPPATPAASAPQRYVQIDEDGYFKLGDRRVTEPEIGAPWLASITIDHRCRAMMKVPAENGSGEVDAVVEAFDEPFIVLSVEPPGANANAWTARMPYDHRETFSLESLNVDAWDRFHGRTERGVPFVFSRAAQSAFFEMVDEFDDDGVTFRGQHFAIPPWLAETPEVDASAKWTGLYQAQDTGWDLGEVSPVFAAIVPRLKLQKSRVLVLGAGTGNDAAFFAEMGHVVTAVDFSEEAVARGRAKYGHLSNLRFLQADAFALPREMDGGFDLILEHTCYCAINPSRRGELVRAWRRCLSPGGHLLGVFFTIDKRQGPPFGSSEWELRARLGKGFRMLFWMRSRHSLEKRAGQEMVVYAQKLDAL